MGHRHLLADGAKIQVANKPNNLQTMQALIPQNGNKKESDQQAYYGVADPLKESRLNTVRSCSHACNQCI